MDACNYMPIVASVLMFMGGVSVAFLAIEFLVWAGQFSIVRKKKGDAP